MTLTTTATRVSHAGNGSTTAFVATAIKIFAITDLKVYLKDNTTLVETLQTYTTHYTISGTIPGVPTVNFVSAPASGKTVILKRVVPNTQDLDLTPSGAFAAENIEAQLDKVTAQVQDLARDLDDFPATASTVYYVTDFGAVCDGTTDDSTAVQAAIAACVAGGGGIVQFPVGTCLIGTTLTVYSSVILRGVSMNTTVLKAKTNLNAAVIQSLNYASLVGTNTWLVSAGVVHGFGLIDLQIDGNKANQSGTANGVELYAKRLTIRDVLIRDCKTMGLVTEAAYTFGQADWTDLPEGSVGPLFIRNCGSYGWRMRGGHDMAIRHVVINECGSDGLRIENDGSTYNGTCDIVFAHIYANDGYGVYANTTFKADHLIVENNDKEGAYLNGNHIHIGALETYTNCKASGTFEVVLTSSANHTIIASANIRGLNDVANGGIQVNADYVQINNASIDGSSISSQGIGLEMVSTADFCSINAKINGFSGTGGIGLKTNSGGGASYNQINARITDCKTLWNNAAVGNYSGYQIRGYAGSGQAFFSGSGPNTTDSRERWDILGLDSGGTTYLSEVRKTSGSSFDLNITTEQSISIGIGEIGWAGTIETEDISYSWVSTVVAGAQELAYLRLVDITGATGSQLANFRLRFRVAAGLAATGNIILQARL